MPSVASISPNRTQTCPHGLPQGACPVCNGMGGGGGGRTRKTPAPKGEMSYSEMVAIWNRMKSSYANKQQIKANLERQIEINQKTREMLTNMIQRLNVVLGKIQSILPKPIANLFSVITNNVLMPIANLIQKFPEMAKNMNQFIQNIKMEVFIAAEKLASVFGEIKNFIQRKVSNSFKKFTKKVYKILNLFGLETKEEFEEDEKVNAEIYAFKAKDVKNLKEMIFRLITKRKEELENAPSNKNSA